MNKPYNAADEDQVKERRRKEKEAFKQAREDLGAVLGMVEGRRFVWRLLTDTGLFKTSFTGNSTTFFNEGQRNVGLKLLAEIHAAFPERYLEMLRDQARPDDDGDSD